MRRLTSVEHKELSGRDFGATTVFDVEERKNHSRRSRVVGSERDLSLREVTEEEPLEAFCEACGQVIAVESGAACYCSQCYQASALEAEAISRQHANRAEALAAERDELLAKVDELTKLLQSRECQMKKLANRVESLERDWRNVTSENQQLRQTLENTELRLANSELERRLVATQVEANALQDVQAAIDNLRREMRAKEQKWLERMAALEKAVEERPRWNWRSLFESWLRPQGETSRPS